MSADSVVITSGVVFAVSSRSGDIHPRTPEGFYAYDTRFLSRFHLSIEGQEPVSVGAASFDHSMASFYASSRGTRNLPAGTISIVRDRYVSHGLHEDISLVNHSSETRKFLLELAFDADFADVFEVRLGPARKVGRTTFEYRQGKQLRLGYRRGSFSRETQIVFSSEPIMRGKTAVFQVTLPPKGIWKTCVTIFPVLESPPEPMECAQAVLGSPFGPYRRQEPLPPRVLKRKEAGEPLVDVPRLETEYIGLQQAYQQAIADLRALLIEQEDGHHILAAGLPWYMAVFGRDSIISAIQTKLLGPELMIGTLHTLVSFQATVRDDFRDAQPGKIPHEARKGELSVLELVPHSSYYGSVDATPLFLILLWEAYQWTGDVDLLRRFLPAAEAALQWIDRYGDVDQDGFVEYQRRKRTGQRNQGWKDSTDAISFADGSLAAGPIALVEVQGYVYDAKRKMAEVYRLLGNPSKARKLDRAAQRLWDHFNEAFWMEDKGYYAMALDGRKRQVDSIASNPGHCLWSGIISLDKAPRVVEQLMAADMFSGWGIRTLSTEMARYNPLSYHNGSVWPHDNSIIAAGFFRYGFTKEAAEVAFAILDAAAFSDHRLPELFAGYPRRGHSFPVPYPGANVPQAWASGAAVYLLETLLGAIPAGDRLLLEAVRERPPISLSGVRYRGNRLVL